MGALTYRSGALARAIQPLVTDPGAAVVPAANVLASLLDLRGSVELADVLSQRFQGAALAPVPFTRAAEARTHLAAIEADITLRLASPFTDRPRLPDAQAMHAALVGAAPASEATLSALAAPFRERTVSLVERVRAQIAEVRALFADDVADADAGAARVIALDRVLVAATSEGLARTLSRLGAAMEAAVVRELTVATKALPANAGVDDVATWLGEGGCLRAHVDCMSAVTRAVFAHERAVLEALLLRAARGAS